MGIPYEVDNAKRCLASISFICRLKSIEKLTCQACAERISYFAVCDILVGPKNNKNPILNFFDGLRMG